MLPRLSKLDAKALIGKDRRIGSKITACLAERVRRCMLKAECSRVPGQTEMLISYPDSGNVPLLRAPKGMCAQPIRDTILLTL